MRGHSELFNKYYNTEDVRFIVNMQQNYKYLSCEKALPELVDIICGNDNKIVFVWKKSPLMDELYTKWCNHEL